MIFHHYIGNASMQLKASFGPLHLPKALDFIRCERNGGAGNTKKGEGRGEKGGGGGSQGAPRGREERDNDQQRTEAKMPAGGQ